MNIIVAIEGREAIPVRAIPLLTDWTYMSPDRIADALAGDQTHHWQFTGLTANTIEDHCIRSIPTTWWQNFPCRALKAIGDRIVHEQISDNTGYQDWKLQSLAALPAGTFVWRDEYEPMFYRCVAPRSAVAYEDGDELRPRYFKLQFDPFVPDPTIQQLVMEGFDPPSEPEHAAPPLPSEEEFLSPPARDLDLLATPEQLVGAFGVWGLKASWFKAPKGHAWLFSARQVKGQGQRGHVTAPLYCPYAVMNGLITQIRNRKRLATDKGWHILQTHFPKVYAVHEMGDPREGVTS